MKLMRLTTLGLAISLALSACGTTSKTTPSPTPSPTPTANTTTCYIGTVGNDQARIRLDSPITANSKISGILEYRFAQKDQTWGIFSGDASTSELSINYQYSSEGVVSNRDIVYKYDGTDISGEGFTFKPSIPCQFTITPYEWKTLNTANVKADTTHDPETGYYARLKFDFTDKLSKVKFRCIGKVSAKDGSEINKWITLGVQDKSGNLRDYIMMANIKPDQVSLVSSGSVECEYTTL